MGNCCSEPMTGRHAEVVIGAPTMQTVDHIKAAYDKYGKGLTLFIAADLKTFMKQLAKDITDVSSIPTNLRAPYQYRPGIPGEESQPIVLEGITLDSFAAFMELQEMISEYVRAILEFAAANDIPTYFPIVGRNERPTHLQVSPEGDRVVAFPPDEGPRAKHPGSNQELSSLALDILVEPAFKNAGRSLLEDLKRCTGYEATYLADVLAIVGAKLTKNPNFWESWSLTSCEVRHDGRHTKDIFGDKNATKKAKNIPYCKADFVPKSDGHFYSMDSSSPGFDQSEFNDALRTMLDEHASGSPMPIWDTCRVTHDSFALDVDDLPALELAKGLTIPGGFTTDITWREV